MINFFYICIRVVQICFGVVDVVYELYTVRTIYTVRGGLGIETTRHRLASGLKQYNEEGWGHGVPGFRYRRISNPPRTVYSIRDLVSLVPTHLGRRPHQHLRCGHKCVEFP